MLAIHIDHLQREKVAHCQQYIPRDDISSFDVHDAVVGWWKFWAKPRRVLSIYMYDKAQDSYRYLYEQCKSKNVLRDYLGNRVDSYPHMEKWPDL